MGSYAKGNPLGLKVLGSNLYDKGMREWESEIVKWERTLDMEIQKILRMSYDGIDSDEKSIFLDVACFFSKGSKYRVLEIRECGSFLGEKAIRRLIDTCLIYISENKIYEDT